MGLHYTGTFLAVKEDHVTPSAGQTFEAFTSITLTCIDSGRVSELRIARDFPPNHLAELNKAAMGAEVSLDVFVSKGRLYATEVTALRVPESAKS